MSIVSIDHAAGTVRHRCERCGHERDLCLDPLYGDIEVHREHGAIVLAPCPACAGQWHPDVRGPAVTREVLILNHPPHEHALLDPETGLPLPHPGSLVGTRFEDTGGVVTEHTVGYHHAAHRVEQVRLITAMQRHPHLAAHAPYAHEEQLAAHERKVREHAERQAERRQAEQARKEAQ